MKKMIPCVCLIAMLASGCASYYQITLQNGNRITTKGKPKFQNGWYVYRDINGFTNAVSSGSVREIGPRPHGYSEEPSFKSSGRR